MSVDMSWDIESYRTAYESDEHWTLKRDFMEAHKERIPETRLICLAQVFVNIELLGCKYPDPVMEQVSVLARDVGHDYKESKKNKLKRTFVKASDAAEAKVKGTRTSSLIGASSSYESPLSTEQSTCRSPASPRPSPVSASGRAMPSLLGPTPQTRYTALAKTMAFVKGGVCNPLDSVGGDANCIGGGGNTTSSMLSGGENSSSSMFGGSGNSLLGSGSASRQMCGGGANSMSSMYGGSGNSLLGSGSFSNSTSSMLGGSFSNSTYSGSKTTLITAPPAPKKKKSKDKDKGKHITEKFVKFTFSQSESEANTASATASATTSAMANTVPLQKVATTHHHTQPAHNTMHQGQRSHNTQPNWPNQQGQPNQTNRPTGQTQPNQFNQQTQPNQFNHNQSNRFNQQTQPNQQNQPNRFNQPNQQTWPTQTNRQPQPAQPGQSQPNAKPSTQQQNPHLSNWCKVVGRNNPLAGFVIVRHESRDNGSAAAILNTSSCFSRMPINYHHKKLDTHFECTVNINGVDVVTSKAPRRKKAREVAVVEAVAELPKHCFTLKIKRNIQAESVTLDQVANDLGLHSSFNNPMGGNSVANKMMKQMGWTGGGLGKKGEGITEPIRPSEVFGRQGLGHTDTNKDAVTPAFRKRVRDIVHEYACNTKKAALAFSNEFSKDQRAEIHKIARLSHLKSACHGKEGNRCLVITRKMPAQDLLLRLLQEGSDDHYELLPPSSTC